MTISINESSQFTNAYSIGNSLEVKIANGETNYTTYIRGNGELLARKDSDNSMHYYLNDHLGGTHLVLNANGELEERTTYYPFGGVLSGGDSRFTYTGQESDQETGLMYYKARYYNPQLKRFTQPDSIVQDWYDPQTLNRYTYVRNNPIKYNDPTGHLAFAALAAPALIGAVGGMAYYGLSTPADQRTWGGYAKYGAYGVGAAMVGVGMGGAAAALGAGAWGTAAVTGTSANLAFTTETNVDEGRQGLPTGDQAVVDVGLGVIGASISVKAISPLMSKYNAKSVIVNVVNEKGVVTSTITITPENLNQVIEEVGGEGVEFVIEELIQSTSDDDKGSSDSRNRNSGNQNQNQQPLDDEKR